MFFFTAPGLNIRICEIFPRFVVQLTADLEYGFKTALVVVHVLLQLAGLHVEHVDQHLNTIIQTLLLETKPT